MPRRTLFPLCVLVFLTLLLAACGGSSNSGPPPPPPPPPTLTLTTAVSGLSNPLALEHPPGDNRFFVVEQRGIIRIIENGTLRAGNFLDIQSLTNFDGVEQGLLGLAFHPNYSTNRLFYVNYTTDSGGRHSVIAEFQTKASDPNQADPASQRNLLTVSQPFTNHKGGQLAFGPEPGPQHFLYLGLGDGGSGGDPLGNGQNLSVLFGKILRIGVDPPFSPGLQYAIPADNPFVGGAGLPEIWAYGLRNPWRFSFERGGTRLVPQVRAPGLGANLGITDSAHSRIAPLYIVRGLKCFQEPRRSRHVRTTVEERPFQGRVPDHFGGGLQARWSPSHRG